jgi:hypothetical protein
MLPVYTLKRSRNNITRKRTVKHEEQTRRIEQIVSKAWIDEQFKNKLRADPAGVLRGEGVRIPQGVEIRLMEDTDNVRHVVLPVKPSVQEITEEQFKVHGRPA